MRPKIYLFGDSITEESFSDGGWGASLANHFARKLDVVLRGYGGYNTRWALKMIEKMFPSSDSNDPPLAITVFFGANDACLADRSSSSQHVPLNEYKKNLHTIIAFFKKQWPTARVILITPPPIDEDGRLQYPYIDNVSGLPERTNEAAGHYAKQCLAVAAECNVLAIDLWNKMQLVSGWQKLYLRDGLHLTRDGNKVVFEEVIGRLSEAHISTMTLPTDLPDIEDIYPSDPLKAFEN
ncbi:GDSL esterase/lipase at5g45920 [Phtheirospermum japonicum]|uniref:GDSL esterase/lipase at5g45920 n=1 Tax=Phtheirospermum japonicum TaxID=374723 RepID=A0A830DGX4_9LAMI|nr:GDSL esterase/lipase at5g45920 [Phtheirospermum japonicum]